MAVLLLIGFTMSFTSGCKAQTPAASEAQSNRRIEVIVRSQFNIPADVAITVNPRLPSTINGYQTQPITLTRDGHSQQIDFLISQDGQTLARLETFDLKKSAFFNIETEKRPVRGNPTAPVTVITFDDLECPYCARMHQQLFPSTLERYKDKVRFIYKDYPLESIHPWAVHAAVDANCLFAQSNATYWKYVDYIHSHPQEMQSDDHNIGYSFLALDRIARQQGTLDKLEMTALNACLDKQDESQVRASMKEGEKLNLEGAPALFIDGEKINGAIPEDQVWMVIDRALQSAGVPLPPPMPQTLQQPANPATLLTNPGGGTK
jgi:protein-disulfide isomerase